MADVLVGMSGGIDSTMVAWLLKQQGHNVKAVTMSIWKPDRPFHGNPERDSCFGPSEKHDLGKIRALCEKIGIEHIALDISDVYENTILKYFRDEYLSGHTPNPCVFCNQKIKFGAMIDEAERAGIRFDYFATGHYARIEKQGGRYLLKRGKDLLKDQSYFLYRLSQQQLSRVLFPLGDYTKAEIRKMDAELGFHPGTQTESQDFYSGPYSDLLDVEPREGNIVDTSGKVLGKHNGMWNYTIGQRKGLGVSAPHPLYVVALHPERNEVVVGTEDQVIHCIVTASDVNWVSVDSIKEPMKAEAKIRSTGNPVPCTVSTLADGRICASFDLPVKAATRGQSLVVYSADTVLCGGIIDSAN